LLLPLVGVGLMATVFSLYLSYRFVPRSEAVKETLLEELNRKDKRKKPEDKAVEAQVFRDRDERRTWFVRKLQPEPGLLHGVVVIQQDADENIVEKFYANRARYHEPNGTWVLEHGKHVYFNRAGDIVHEDLWLDGKRRISEWSETPWRIASANLEPQNLTVPELRQYLSYNADFPETQLAPYRTYLHHRWAFPWTCVISVLVAAPLGIVYSRRGILAGVTGAFSIFFIMLFLINLCLALGKGSRVSPAFAAWAPIIIFCAVGLFLLFVRSTNRELPRFFGGWE
jgi:lipopolysaccharide export system permease protein